jgi:predicted CoA-binding protein
MCAQGHSGRWDSIGDMAASVWSNPGEAELRSLLQRVKRVAVVGLSPKAHRDSHRVALYMQQHGYEIVPVYPREERILGEPVYRRLQDVPGRVDLVDVFRRSEHLPEVVEDAVAARAPALWFQVGCVHEGAARRAAAAGAMVVMDLCLMVEHARLLGA